MKYILFVLDTASNSGSEGELAQINEFNADIQRAGNWVLAAGIGSPATAEIVDNRKKARIVNQSSLNSNEFYSGFWIIQAESLTEAREIALRASEACNRRVELRPFLGDS